MLTNADFRRAGITKAEVLFQLCILKARADFAFFRRFLNKNDLTKSAWQLDACKALQDFAWDLAHGNRPKLVIEAPPQHGKSKMIVEFIAWLVGRSPNLKVIYTSFSERLGERANLHLQRILTSERFKQIFPNCRISEVGQGGDGNASRNRSLIEFLDNDGYFRNTTVRGAITGETLDLGVIDDPIKSREEASSKAVRDKTWDWFTDDFFTRFSKNAGMLAILTRWHLDDPIGRLKAQTTGVRCLTYKAIAEADDILGREVGEPLFPELKPLDFLLERKAAMANANWLALYQQSPQVEGGEIIHVKDFQYYSVAPDYEWCAIFADTAQKTKEHNDYSVFECWGFAGENRFILLDLARGKWEAPELERMALSFWQKWRKARFFAIEDKVSGTGLIQSIRRRGVPTQAIQRDKDKYTRLLDVLGYIESGFVWLPENAPWLADFLAECEAFSADGGHMHDDQVDPMVDAIKYGVDGNSAIYDWENIL